MPTTIPALRGKFGKTEYWLTTMRIAELITKIQMPTDIEGWDEYTVEEKFQREVNVRRVIQEIAPYFASDENRFTGSLVLAILNPDNIEFEPLGDFSGSKNVPGLYRSASREIGFLTLNGGEMLVPIDGQHRAKAFKFAMNGTDDNGRAIAGIKSNTALGEDQAPVILMKFDKVTSRLIFNKINRYAKPTTKSDNLITDDDDAIAVITRRLLDKMLPMRLVKLGSNTLPANAPELIPIATFYEANLAIASELPGAGKPTQMNEEQRNIAEGEIHEVWNLLLDRIDLFAAALYDTTAQGDATRIRIREDTLLGKPIGQLSLVRAFLLMKERCEGVPGIVLCERLNKVDWGLNQPQWENVLMASNGRVMSGKTTVNRAAKYIAHLGGAQLTSEERDELLEAIHGSDWQSHELPSPVV